ncbi:hypothetical protein ScPMuIL_009177 [Solemya velum]
MGKLDAICAKLKQVNHVDQDGTELVQENNNNEKLLTNGLEQNVYKHKIFENETPSGRRKKRKTATPRNLSQVQEYLEQFDDKDDELAEYEINNQHTDFPPDDHASRDLRVQVEFNESFADVLSEKSPIPPVCDEKEPTSPKPEYNGNCAIPEDSSPLDLSLVRTPEDASYNQVKEDMGNATEEKDSMTLGNDSCIDEIIKKTSSNTDIPSRPTEPNESGETTVLKDYAETTMNELLQMYGFEGKSDTVTKQVPLQNFSTKQILQAKLQNNLKVKGPLSKMSRGNPLTGLSTANKAKALISNFVNNMKTPINEVTKPVPTSSCSPVFKAIYCSPQPKRFDNSPSSKKSPLPDYSKYLKKFHNGEICGGSHCKDLSYKEHYHCMDCSFRVFIKKEEMVRHLKWHKKREESLQHGFLRYSPMDDCGQKFGDGCTHNGRQTHYHCLQSGCDKVYISTSDVQMHANYHRKDSAIIQEGFQRFRATEDCGTQSCAFYGQRTTHFHCRRVGCKFTFKNKADMEKHKGYHQKDEILGRDGFKKFMKYENCGYQTCRYSKVNNHIHCIRPGCNYVLHSTAQLYSHKRRHEKREIETYYRKIQEERAKQHIQQMTSVTTPSIKTLPAAQMFTNPHMTSIQPTSPGHLIAGQLAVKQETMTEPETKNNDSEFSQEISLDMSTVSYSDDASFDSKNVSPNSSIYGSEKLPGAQPCYIQSNKLNDSLSLPIPMIQNRDNFDDQDADGEGDVSSSPSLSPTCSMESPSTPSTAEMSGADISSIVIPPAMKNFSFEKRDKNETWKKYLERFTANDHCNSRCCYLYKDHYHCRVEGCSVLFRSKDGVREHARLHDLQSCLTPMAFRTYTAEESCPNNCQYSENKKHFHCNWSGCTHVVPIDGPAFGRLEHYRVHDYARLAAGRMYKPTTMKVEEDKRRRGRPPKFPRTGYIPIVPKVELSDSEILESGKIMTEEDMDKENKIINGFKLFEADERCPDDLCTYSVSKHYHCARPRCHHSTDRLDVLNLHAKDFHSFVNILEGFEFFDRNINCRRAHCQNNKANKHYHCVRAKCDYSFVRQSTMFQHDKKHQGDLNKIPLAPVIKLEPTDSSIKGFVPIMPVDPIPSSPTVDTSNNSNLADAANNGLVSGDLSSKVVVKTSGTFFPLSGLQTVPLSAVIGPSPAPGTTINTSSSEVVSHSMMSPIPLVSISNTVAIPGPAVSSEIPLGSHGVPLTVLLQQKTGNEFPQPSWPLMRANMHYNIQQICGRPFCKLKRKDHYHCFECNQAFSDPARLRCHVAKHGFRFRRCESNMRVIRPSVPVHIAPKPPQNLLLEAVKSPLEIDDSDLSPETKSTSEINPSSSLTLNPSIFSNMIAKAQEEHRSQTDGNLDFDEPDSSIDNGKSLGVSEEAMLGTSGQGHLMESDGDLSEQENSTSVEIHGSDGILSSLKNSNKSRRSGRKRVATKRNDFIDSDEMVAKQRKLSTSPRANRDESIPDGYIRCSFKDDCGYPKCSYRRGVTHFHCTRLDCGYSFSDRSRLVQHTLRHERIDSITGGELQQYRINQDCGVSECEFNKKASHFHCFKCSYSCTDSSKVLTHRKYHAKMNSINSQGFQKFSVSQECQINGCNYSKKQTHYHCLSPGCNHAVLGPSQMAPHKVKHQESV